LLHFRRISALPLSSVSSESLAFLNFKRNGGTAMWERNNGDENSALQNQFTAYLMTAIRNRKTTYLHCLSHLQQYEQSLELSDNLREAATDVDFLFDLTLYQQLEDMRLYHALKQIKKHEQYIFFARALDERPFAEIAKELGMSYGAVAMAYYRTIERIRTAMGGEKK
jgi:RNA polymerase sigma factor (sigma-70 family)